LRADGDLLEDGERTHIAAAIEQLEAATTSGAPEAIVTSTAALSAATEDFAMMRMNRSIRTALSGTRVDEVFASAPQAPR